MVHRQLMRATEIYFRTRLGRSVARDVVRRPTNHATIASPSAAAVSCRLRKETVPHYGKRVVMACDGDISRRRRRSAGNDRSVCEYSLHQQCRIAEPFLMVGWFGDPVGVPCRLLL